MHRSNQQNPESSLLSSSAWLNLFLRHNRKLSWVMGVLLILILTISYALNRIENQIRQSAMDSMSTVLAMAQNSLHLWAQNALKLSTRWSDNTQLRELIKHQMTYLNTPSQLQTTSYLNQLQGQLNSAMTMTGAEGFYIVTLDGRVIAAHRAVYIGELHGLKLIDQNSFRRLFNGESLVTAPLKTQPGLFDVNGVPIDNNPAVFVGSPVRDEDGAILAILLFRFDSQKTIEHIVETGQLGKSGETYLLNQQGLLVSATRFTEQLYRTGLVRKGSNPAFNLLISDPGRDLLQNDSTQLQDPAWPLTRMAAQISQKKSGNDMDGYRDYRGVRVLGTWHWDELLGIGIAHELDEEEVLRPYYAARAMILFILLVTILLSVILSIRLGVFRVRSAVLGQISYIDSLTGIANRRRFDEELLKQWQISRRAKLPVSLLMIDVDHFKAYNDQYGHQAGDQCLRSISQALQNTGRRSQDLVARYGGEEFTVLMPITEQTSALVIANKLQQAIIDLQIAHATSAVSNVVTVSIGLATMVAHEHEEATELVERADRALYAAKHQGRNRVVVA